jgi:glycosyltransferase involved in cell wall biosynthesis
MLGTVPHSEIPKYLKTAALAAFPYVWGAGPGNAIFEALTFGVPTVVSEFNSFITQLAAKKCVLAVPPKDELGMADAILRLLSNAELRKTIAKNGRRYAEENLSAERVAVVWKSIIARAIATQ